MSRFWVFAVLLLVASCDAPPGQGEAPQSVHGQALENGHQTPFQRDLAPKLAECAGCHSGEQPQAGLDLSHIRDSIGVQSAQVEMALIQPGNHLHSYLWHKVAGTQSIAGGLGQQMPAHSPWAQADIDLLARWIDLGAPE